MHRPAPSVRESRYFTVTFTGFDAVSPFAFANTATTVWSPDATPLSFTDADCAFGVAAASEPEPITTPSSSNR